MSVSELLDDNKHPWANIRVNDLTVDGKYVGPGVEGPTGPRGETGPQGERGPQGPVGSDTFERITLTGSINQIRFTDPAGDNILNINSNISGIGFRSVNYIAAEEVDTLVSEKAAQTIDNKKLNLCTGLLFSGTNQMELNIYNRSVINVEWAGSLWSGTVNSMLRLSRIGNIVTAHFDPAESMGISGQDSITMSPALPTIYRPYIASTYLYVASVLGTASGVFFYGRLAISGGSVSFTFLSPPGAVQCGFQNFSLSWLASA